MERKAFGQAIFDFQAVAFMLADMSIGVETARLAMHRSAWASDNKDPRSTILASIAKCYAGDVANKCATDAVQVGNKFLFIFFAVLFILFLCFLFFIIL